MKKYNLLMYVECCSPKIKRFDTLKDLKTFVKKFTKRFPDDKATDTGNWIDYYVTGVTGRVVSNDSLDFEVT